ncbi:MAG: hypothetical protein J5865_00510 [Lachnospiraceae bacterium]|nr:hypothetical protein [Lachnospiraceae bacterium]
MPRYISEFQTNVPAQYTFDAFNQYLSSEGYEYTNFKNEPVFKKGKGLATGPTFVKLTISDDLIVRIEAWCKYAILPGIYAGEMGLDGAAGVAIKKPLKQRIIYLENMLMQAGAVPLAAQPSFVSGVIGTQPYRFAQQNPQVDPQAVQHQQYMQQQQVLQQQMMQQQQMRDQQLVQQQIQQQQQTMQQIQQQQMTQQMQPDPNIQMVQQSVLQNQQMVQNRPEPPKPGV